MKNNCVITALMMLMCIGINAQSLLRKQLEKHVYTLADDSLKGRRAGSEDAAKAARYIENEWRKIGITPYKDNNTYTHSFDHYKNLVGIIEGSDPALKHEYIVVGAHYDHLGINRGTVYNGADDNASGVAAITEMARLLKAKQQQLGRTIILVAFDAEETGLVGSRIFIRDALFPAGNIKLMVSVDMVGWYKTSGYVKYQGIGTLLNGEEILFKSDLVPKGLNVTAQNFEKSVFTATDTEAFAISGIPTLAVTTGIKSPYHKPEDDASLIDYDGLEMITTHLANVVGYFSVQKQTLASGKFASKHKRSKKFEIGITAGGGSNYHHYTAGAVNGKPATSFNAGITSQFNRGVFAIRPEVYYERINAMHPKGKVNTDNITIPLSLVLQMPPTISGGVDIFVGGYYSYMINGWQEGRNPDFRNMYNNYEAGLNFGFGVRVANLKLNFNIREALTRFTIYKNSDGAHIRNNRTVCTLAWIF